MSTKIEISFFALTMCLFSCDKIRLFKAGTIRICEAKNNCGCSLYVESFHVGGTAEYLTDSATFRIFVGQFDDETGLINYKCFKDSIIITKQERDENYIEYSPLKTVFKRKYLLRDLKQLNNY